MKSKGKFKKYLETNDIENITMQKSMGCSKSSSKRSIHSDTGFPKKQTTNKLWHKEPNPPPKELRKKKKKESLKSVDGKK